MERGEGGHLKVKLFCLQEFVSYFLILQVLNQIQGFNLRELGGCPGFQVEGVAQPIFVIFEFFSVFLLLFKWAKYDTVCVCVCVCMFCQLYCHLCHPRS